MSEHKDMKMSQFVKRCDLKWEDAVKKGAQVGAAAAQHAGPGLM